MLNKSAMEANPKPVIRIHKRQQQSVNIDTVFTKNDISFISNISNISITEEPIVVPKRPKSSQSGTYHNTLKTKAFKTKLTNPKKYKRRHTNSHTDDLLLPNANDPQNKDDLNSSLQKYMMGSLGLAAKGLDAQAKSVKTQMKNPVVPMFSKKTADDDSDLFDKVMVNNFAVHNNIKEIQKPTTAVFFTL